MTEPADPAVDPILLEAFFWGVVSSVSLPIGALLGIYLKVSRRVNSALLAFGAGALLFAITIELYGHAICEHEHSGGGDKLPMILLAVGSLIGSALFSGSNYVIEHQSNLKSKIVIKPTLMLANARSNLSKMGRSSSFNLSSLSFSFKRPEEAEPDPIPDEEVPYHSAGARYRIDDDEDDDEDQTQAHTDGDDEHTPMNGGGKAVDADRDDSDAASYGAMDASETVPLNDRSAHGSVPVTSASLGYQAAAMAGSSSATKAAAAPHLAIATAGAGLPDADGHAAAGPASSSPGTPGDHAFPETAALADEHGGKKRRGSISSQTSNDPTHDQQVGVAIWLGLLIDSLPESLVIGILATAEDGISITFILGVFLSNLPEALSSTVIMRRAGLGRMRIMIMWSSIMIITGIGAFIGAIAFRGDPTTSKELAAKSIEGIAAGAMLVMIAETALPEAFRHAGKLQGICTLSGFLAAYLVKLIDD